MLPLGLYGMWKSDSIEGKKLILRDFSFWPDIYQNVTCINTESQQESKEIRDIYTFQTSEQWILYKT